MFLDPYLYLVLSSQPVAQPISNVAIHAFIGLAHRTKPKIVSPSLYHQVEFSNQFFGVSPASVSLGLLADALTEFEYTFLRGFGPNIGLACFDPITPPQRIPQEVERFFGYMPDS